MTDKWELDNEKRMQSGGHEESYCSPDDYLNMIFYTYGLISNKIRNPSFSDGTWNLTANFPFFQTRRRKDAYNRDS